MKLANLLTVDALSDARFASLEVDGITADSRTVKPGDLFVAMAGSKDDGMHFVAPAIAGTSILTGQNCFKSASTRSLTSLNARGR